MESKFQPLPSFFKALLDDNRRLTSKLVPGAPHRLGLPCVQNREVIKVGSRSRESGAVNFYNFLKRVVITINIAIKASGLTNFKRFYRAYNGILTLE